MCGRFTLYESASTLVDRFTAGIVDGDVAPRYNIAPTEVTPVVTNRTSRLIEMLRWGLVPSWADNPSIGTRMINARSESLAEKPAFRKPFMNRRCIVPANGFYEWKMNEKRSKGPKQPAYVHSVDDGILALAGLWDVWKQPDGRWLKTFTIITVPANEQLLEYHIRMPAILRREDEARWLDQAITDPTAVSALLRTAPPDGLKLYPVSTAVNSAGVDHPSLIERATEPVSLALDV